MAVRRDWRLAHAKIEREGVCRVCAAPRPHAAHTAGRVHDAPGPGGRLVVHPDDVVPLCRGCHIDYDGRRLDLLPHLTRAEQARLVVHLGLVGALRRACGGTGVSSSHVLAP